MIRLDANENCLGPSPSVLEAIKKAATTSNRYPESEGNELCEALAGQLRISPSQILLGHGSTDLIGLIAKTVLQPGDQAITAAGTFIMYSHSVRSMNAECVEVPLLDYCYDLNLILKAITGRTRVIYIANPNNPTGTAVEPGQLLRSVRTNVLVVVDEAYYEYAEAEGYRSALVHLSDFENLIVLRTFSKVHSLAGLRIGYAIGSEKIVDGLRQLNAPFSTSTVAQAAALAALQDEDHVRRSVEHNRHERKFMEHEVGRMKISYVPSVTNFILLLVSDPIGLTEQMRQKSILIRPMGPFGIPNGVRVTVGTHDENASFINAFRGVLSGRS